MSEKWIQQAVAKHPGALRRALHAKEGKAIPYSDLVKASHSPGTMGKRARLALTLRKLHHR